MLTSGWSRQPEVSMSPIPVPAQAFGGHAWNEVVLDDQWVSVDPAWDETELDASHVRIGHTQPDEARALNLFHVVATFGKVSFKVIALEREGDRSRWGPVALSLSLLVAGVVAVWLVWKSARAGRRRWPFLSPVSRAKG